MLSLRTQFVALESVVSLLAISLEIHAQDAEGRSSAVPVWLQAARSTLAKRQRHRVRLLLRGLRPRCWRLPRRQPESQMFRLALAVAR